MSNLIVMVGIPSSGKSSVANKMKEENNNIVVLSSDELRIELFGDVDNQENNSKVFEEMKIRTVKYLKEGKDVIYDATNLSSKRRKVLLLETKKYYDKAICIFKLKRLSECLGDNEFRKKRVPRRVIQDMYRKIDTPYYGEGFDEIKIDFDYQESIYCEKLTKECFNFDLGYMTYYRFLENYLHLYDMNMSQDSKYHTLSLSKHMYFTYDYLVKQGIEDENLLIASMLHDIGKKYVRIEDKECRYAHYYGHEHASAYEVAILLKKYTNISDDDILDICMLINYHMRLMGKEKDDRLKKLIGQDNYDRILLLHNADMNAK